MGSKYEKLHIIMFPMMAPGHMIPMMDIARLLALRGAAITIFTTHANAARFEPVLCRARESGLRISLISLRFPREEAGLPEGLENLDTLTDPNLLPGFFHATTLLCQPVEKLAMALEPRPNCIVSDMLLPWTQSIARMFEIPRVSFLGANCFFHMCLKNLGGIAEKISSETEYFAIPDIPDRIEITKAQALTPPCPNLEEHYAQLNEAEKSASGIIINSFEELEPEYAELYKRARHGNAWCVGPASLSTRASIDKAQRGTGQPVSGEHDCLKWLDSQEPSSVVYVCLGSLCNLTTPQLIELGAGLEASDKPFLWVIAGRKIEWEEIEKWIEEDGFEERVKGKGQGLLIRGWAPQTLILSHPSIGGFLTHCGWNSTLEGICAGLPLITWPTFGDQFLNEKLVVGVLRIGVSLGVESPVKWGEEEKIGVQVRRERIKMALERLMSGGESVEMRARARELGKTAKRAVQEGGSSHHNITLFLDEILKFSSC